jgi:uncharacterized protein (TIGR02246 family)
MPRGTKNPIRASGNVKVMDVAWLGSDYAKLLEQSRPLILERAPQICIEVLSESNSPEEMAEKRGLYFEAGAKEVWICSAGRALKFLLRGRPVRKLGDLQPVPKTDLKDQNEFFFPHEQEARRDHFRRQVRRSHEATQEIIVRHREKPVNIRSLLALTGLAISFALPAFGQEKEPVIDPQIVQELQAIGKKSDEAFLKGDAAAVAALYTEDAVLVNDTRPVYGRQAIQKYYADHFQQVRYFRHDTKYDPTSVHLIGTGGNVVRENGEWSGTLFLQDEDCGPHQVMGYFASVSVREGSTWRVCMSTFSMDPQRLTNTATNH